jgi:hypothetical protein
MKQTVSFGSRSFSNDKLEPESPMNMTQTRKIDHNVEDL